MTLQILKACLVPGLVFFPLLSSATPKDSPGAGPTRKGMELAVACFRSHAGFQGAYVYRCSADFSRREGENEAFPATGWVEPPGTPAVGRAFLQAWRFTGSQACLDAAVEAALALVAGQLQSGGWDSRFELDPQHRKRYAYRTDGPRAGNLNLTTLDDNKTQSALLLLMLVDEALQFQNARIHEAVEYALQHILAAQYPNGAWPQRFSGPPDAAKYPVVRASYPESWSRTFPKQSYHSFYTLNDGNLSDLVATLFQAVRIYGREDCRRAAEKAGDFFLLAQMPDPQPGWAQQYDAEMRPVWARKFEPPAISGSESQTVMNTLLDLYLWTGQKRYLEPLPRALAYYQRSLRPDGQLARFYELRSNKPLYCTKDYQLTYSDADMPTHYGFVVSSKLDRIRKRYESLLNDPLARLELPKAFPSPPHLSAALAKDADKVLSSLDSQGAWMEKGRLDSQPEGNGSGRIVDSRTFIRNLSTLAGYIAAAEASDSGR